MRWLTALVVPAGLLALACTPSTPPQSGAPLGPTTLSADAASTSPEPTPRPVADATPDAARNETPREVARGALGPSGGSLVLEQHEGELAIVASDGKAVSPHRFPLGYIGRLPPDIQASFVDMNDDRQNDVVVFFSGGRDLPNGGAIFLTPSLATLDAGSGGDRLAADPALMLATLGATSLDDVIARARAVPRMSVSVQEACKVVSRGRTVRGFRTVATPDARIVLYAEPVGVTGVKSITRVADLHEDPPAPEGEQRDPTPASVLRRIGDGCPGKGQSRVMTCDARVAACLESGGVGVTAYLFARVGGQLKVTAVAVYVGS